MRKKFALVMGLTLSLNFMFTPEIYSANKNYAVWWGDSLTAGSGGNGISGPSELEKLLKIKIQNRGVGGENSTQIAVRSGAESISLKFFGQGRRDGAWKVYDVEPSIRLLLQGANVIAGSIDKCVTILKYEGGKYSARIFKCSKDFASEIKEFSLTGIDQINTSAKFHVIWAGRNNAYDSQTVLSDISNMIANFHRVNSKSKVYVLSVINGDSEGIGTSAYSDITKLNERMMELDAVLVDVRSCLIKDGLAINKIKAKSQDKIDMAADLVPRQLRSDNIHLNAFGYRAVAVCVKKSLDLK